MIGAANATLFMSGEDEEAKASRLSAGRRGGIMVDVGGTDAMVEIEKAIFSRAGGRFAFALTEGQK